MGMATGGNDSGLNSEINVTPLVDVVLVLLIIFMVVIPLTLRGHDLDVPGEAVASVSSPPEERPEQYVMTIDPNGCPVIAPPTAPGLPADCDVRLNDETVAADGLEARVAEIFAGRRDEDRVLFLAVHERMNYEAVMRIVDAAKSAAPGLRIGLVAPAEG